MVTLEHIFIHGRDPEKGGDFVGTAWVTTSGEAVKYVRADLHDAAIRQARDDALEDFKRKLIDEMDRRERLIGPWTRMIDTLFGGKMYRDAIEHVLKYPMIDKET